MTMYVRFIIRPNRTFRQKLEQFPSGLADVFRATVMWTIAHPDRVTWNHEDACEYVKILWLASILEFSGQDDFSKFFGSLLIEIKTFDTYWELDVVGDEVDVAEVLDDLPDSVAQQVSRTYPKSEMFKKTICRE